MATIYNMASEHPAYNGALQQAVHAAARGTEQAVYFNGTHMFVRAASLPRPDASVLVCIAQRWDEKTVQLRFAGAHSEFINI